MSWEMPHCVQCGLDVERNLGLVKFSSSYIVDKYRDIVEDEVFAEGKMMIRNKHKESKIKIEHIE